MYNKNSQVFRHKRKFNLWATKLFFLAIFSIALVNVWSNLSAEAQETTYDTQTQSYVNQPLSSNFAPLSSTIPTFITPTITIDHMNLTLVKNNTGWLRATVLPTTGNQKVYWFSSDPSIVSVDEYGRLSANQVGVVEIIAASPLGVQAISKVTIINPIEVQPQIQVTTNVSTLHLAAGESKQIYAQVTSTSGHQYGNSFTNNQLVKWITADPYIATVDQSGHITAHHVGQTVIIADAGNNVTATVTLNVNYIRETSIEFHPKVEFQAWKGSSGKLSAAVYPLLISNPTVRYESSDPSVLSVNNSGQYLAIRAGVVVIKAISTNGLTDQRTFTVIEPYVSSPPVSVSMNTTNLDLQIETHAWLLAKVLPATENQSVTWSTSHANIVSVDHSGKLTAMNIGTAEITARSAHGAVAKTIVNVHYAPVTAVDLYVPKINLEIGDIDTFTSQITPRNANPKVRWVSNNPYVASVDDKGNIRSHRVGKAKITAIAENGIFSEIEVNVEFPLRPGISINLPTNYKLTISKGISNRIPVVGAYLDTFPIIGWYSSDPSVVSINHKGEYIALRPGTVVISVYSADGYSDQTTVTVTP